MAENKSVKELLQDLNYKAVNARDRKHFAQIVMGKYAVRRTNYGTDDNLTKLYNGLLFHYSRHRKRRGSLYGP